jgi:hypothetical protein
MKRIYLSGPMTGIEAFNYPFFNAEAERLRGMGYDVVNPAEVNPDATVTWHECLRKDVAALVTCDAIALLDGWEHSKGAHLELHIAHRVGMEVLIANQLGCPHPSPDKSDQRIAP